VLGPGERWAGVSVTGTDAVGLATGLAMTPDAAPGTSRVDLDPKIPVAPDFRPSHPASMARVGARIAVVTTGYDRASDGAGGHVPATAGNWLFFLDGKAPHRVLQALPVPASLGGVAASADGKRVIVGGGGDDAVFVFEEVRGVFVQVARVAFGLKTDLGFGGLGRGQGPFVGEVGLSPDGRRALAVLHGNDALAVLELPESVGSSASKKPAKTNPWATIARTRIALRPGGGVPGGEAPYALAWQGDRAFVASLRDDEVVVVDTRAAKVEARVKVGALPVALALAPNGRTLAVAEANADRVSFVDSRSLAVLGSVSVALHETLRLAGPNALAFSPDGQELAVSLGGANAIARVDLSGGPGAARVRGLVPTGHYPMTVLHEGEAIAVGTAKTEGGPNPLGPWSLPSVALANPYKLGRGAGFALQQEEAAILTHPVAASHELEAALSQQVRWNARLDTLGAPAPEAFARLRGRVRHVIYVIGENRTFDQLFADMPGADGDPNLLLWGRSLSPNQHALADGVLLDHFFVSGDVSGQGWPWSTSARTNDWLERAIPAEYAVRGKYAYAWEGSNRGINVGLATKRERQAWNPATPDDDDLLPGVRDFGAVEAAEEGGAGFLWDEALRRGLTVRNYGFFCDDSRYMVKPSDPVFLSPELREPWKTETRVAFPARASLLERTDPYFRCYDQKFPDVWRVRSWEREFEGYVARGDLPSLSLVRLSHDHFGNFDTAIDGVNTPDTQMADHDYAIGRLVERVAASPYWDDTVVVVTEDDAQNGSDHVHGHRSFVLFAGGAVARGVRSSTRYTTPSVLRTIELLLGLEPLAVPDAVAPPIVEAFDVTGHAPRFRAIVPPVLRTTALPLPPLGPGEAKVTERPRGTARAWAARTRGFDFDEADRVPSSRFERLLAGHLARR
jgi:YVTN family beta-propeller protein